jgi:hypothetical protein
VQHFLTLLEAMAEVLFLPQTEWVAAQLITLPIGQAIARKWSAPHSKTRPKYVNS